MVTESDLVHLRRCVELAREAARAGDQPFGSVLADASGHALFEERNRVVSTGDPTAHPEFALARWAAANLEAHERAAVTAYTSGEHCPMCSAAHGLVGLGRLVFVHSGAQFAQWSGSSGGPVRLLPAREVLPTTEVVGPLEPSGPGAELLEQMRELHSRNS